MISRSQLLRRFAFFLGFSVLIDRVAFFTFAGESDSSEFESFYRLPYQREMVALPYFLRYISSQDAEEKNIIFLGSSPTYGISIQSPQNTYPAALARSLARSQPDLSNIAVYNVSSKGWLLSDIYYVLQRVIDDAEIFFIQLNYHTFSQKILDETVIRHPDLPQALGVPVSLAEAPLLGIQSNPRANFNNSISEWLKKYWFFYREADRIALNLFGDIPDSALYQLYRDRVFAAEEDLRDRYTAFTDLSPTQQTIIANRYRETSQVDLTSDRDSNTEFLFLQKIIALLQKYDKNAIFFMAPLNVDALEFYDAIDWRQYETNVAAIANVVRSSGFQFIDYNPEPLMPEWFFSDISHTTDEGGEYFGDRLFEDTKEAIETWLQP